MEAKESNESWVCFGTVQNYQNGKIILVQDNNKPAPQFWKMPGGQKKKGELFPSITISRELEEELLDSRVRIKTSIPKKMRTFQNPIPHKFLVFEAVCDQTPKPGKEILRLHEFSKEEVLNLIKEGKILPNHAEALKQILGM